MQHVRGPKIDCCYRHGFRYVLNNALMVYENRNSALCSFENVEHKAECYLLIFVRDGTDKRQNPLRPARARILLVKQYLCCYSELLIAIFAESRTEIEPLDGDELNTKGILSRFPNTKKSQTNIRALHFTSII